MRPKRNRLALAAFLLLAGCTGMEKLLQAPSVDVAGVALRDLSFDSVTIDFDLLVKNPNSFGASLSQLDYRFSLENQQLFSGVQTQDLVIAAENQSHVHVPLNVKFKELYSLIQSIQNLDTLKYHFEGHIIPGGLLSSMTIPFSKTGSLPNLRLPQVSLKNLQIIKWSLTGIDLDLALFVKNPNAFGFEIGKLNYDIRLKDNPVANGFTQNLGSIPAKGTGQILLPIKINLIGAAASLASVLSGGQTDCSITGQTSLRSPFGELELPFEAKQTISIIK